MYFNIYQYHCLSSETHLKVQLYFSDVVSEKKNRVFFTSFEHACY